MPGADRHNIQKLVYDVHILEKANAEAVQNQLSRLNKSKIPKLLDDLMSHFQVDDTLIQIEKLEIDLGILRLDRLERDLFESIKNQLTKAFQSLDQPGGKTKVDRLKRQTIQEVQFNTLQHFLKTGTILWSDNQKSQNLDSLFQAILKNPKQYPIKELIKLLQKDQIRKRWVHRFGAKHFEAFIALLFPSGKTFVKRAFQTFKQGQKQENWYRASGFVFQEYLQQILLSELISSKKPSDFSSLSHSLHERLAKRFPVRIQPPLEAWNSQKAKSSSVLPRFSTRYSDRDLALHYLTFGTVPYWASVQQSPDITTLLNEVSKDVSFFLQAFAEMDFPRQSQAIQRLVFRLSDSSRKQMIDRILPKQNQWIQDLKNILIPSKSLQSIVDLDERIDQSILEFYVQQYRGRFIKSKFIQFVLNRLIPTNPKLQDQIWREVAVPLKIRKPTSSNSDSKSKPSMLETKQNRDKKQENLQASSSGESELDYFLFFLEEGYKPWWANEVKNDSIQACFEALIQSKPNALAQALSELFDSEAVRDRFLHQIPEVQRRTFWQQISPELIDPWEEFIPGLLKAFPKAVFPKGQDSTWIESRLWQIRFFDWNRQTAHRSSNLVLRCLKLIAENLDISEITVLERFRQSILDLNPALAEKLESRKASLEFLVHQQLEAARRAAFKVATDPGRMDQLEISFRHIFKSASLSKSIETEQAILLLEEMEKIDPRRRREIVLDLLSNPVSFKRISSIRDNQLLGLCIESIQPRALSEIKRLMSDFEKLFLDMDGFETESFRQIMRSSLFGYLTFKPGFSFDPLRLMDWLMKSFAEQSKVPKVDLLEQLEANHQKRKSSLISQLSITLDRYIIQEKTDSPESPIIRILERIQQEEKTKGLIQSEAVQWFRKQKQRKAKAKQITLERIEPNPNEDSKKTDSSDLPNKLNTSKDNQIDKITRSLDPQRPPDLSKDKTSDQKNDLDKLKSSEKPSSGSEKEKTNKDSKSDAYFEFLKQIKEQQAKEAEKKHEAYKSILTKAQKEKKQQNQQREERRMEFEQKMFGPNSLGKRKKKRKTKPTGINAENPVYVNNAGIIILWPYLNFYFQNLGIDMKKPEDQKRAVHLLQYVVFLTGEAPEEDLTLNKVLCGVPLEEPIPRSIELSPKEKDMSEQLLRAVCKNWDKMENTSNMNLRVSFLQREGKLTEQADGWYLKIEKQVPDLLLERLSWGIGMIKLSWMDKLMHVEWI